MTCSNRTSPAAQHRDGLVIRRIALLRYLPEAIRVQLGLYALPEAHVSRRCILYRPFRNIGYRTSAFLLALGAAEPILAALGLATVPIAHWPPPPLDRPWSITDRHNLKEWVNCHSAGTQDFNRCHNQH